jgi:hypothetical protein
MLCRRRRRRVGRRGRGRRRRRRRRAEENDDDDDDSDAQRSVGRVAPVARRGRGRCPRDASARGCPVEARNSGKETGQKQGGRRSRDAGSQDAGDLKPSGLLSLSYLRK